MSRNRTLILHIGPPKTGTSAVQHALRRQNSLLYPKAGQWWDGAHHNLVFNFFNDDGRQDVVRTDFTKLFQAVGAEAQASDADILISSEALWGRDILAFARGLLPYLAGVERVEILAACREHLALVTSLYNQRLKDPHFMERRTPDEMLAQDAPRLVYRPVLERVAAGPYPVTLLSYHPAADFLSRFLTHAGVGGISLEDDVRNTSLSVKGMIATLAVNRIAATTSRRAELYAALETLPGFFASGAGIFTADAIAGVHSIFDQDCAWLAKTYDIHLGSSLPVPKADGFVINIQERDAILAAVELSGNVPAKFAEALRPFVRHRA